MRTKWPRCSVESYALRHISSCLTKTSLEMMSSMAGGMGGLGGMGNMFQNMMGGMGRGRG